jgi:hypothetical protein
MGERKPRDYWCNWDNVKHELEIITTTLNHSPTWNELSDVGRLDVQNAITRHHGGMNAVRIKMGYPIEKVDAGYWEDWETFERETRALIAALGHFPTRSELVERGLSQIYHAMCSHHGGAEKVKTRLGLEPPKKSNGHWKEIENVKSALQEIMHERNLGRIPSPQELTRWGYSGLLTGIGDYHGGISNMRMLFNEEQLRRGMGVWKNVDFVKSEIEKIMRENGLSDIPSQKVLGGLGHAMVARAIQKYHGGFRKLRALLGIEQKKIENGLWKQEEYALNAARGAMTNLGVTYLPSFNRLNESGYSSLVHAISVHHGGMSEFRKKLGEKSTRAKMGAWKSLEYTLEKAEEAMKKEGWDILPTNTILLERGYSSLGVAIVKYHGGFSTFRDKLSEHVGLPSNRQKTESLLEDYVHG